MLSEASQPEQSLEQSRAVLEQKIRKAEFDLEHAQRELSQAELEHASIQKSWNAPATEYQLLVEKHIQEAQAMIDLYNQRLKKYKTEIEQTNNK